MNIITMIATALSAAATTIQIGKEIKQMNAGKKAASKPAAVAKPTKKTKTGK